MRVQYEITRAFSLTYPTAAEFHRCYRKDSAANKLWSAIYHMLYDEALTDRPIAWRLLREFQAFDVSPPVRGWMVEKTFKLRPDDPQSPFVNFRAIRVHPEYKPREYKGFVLTRDGGPDAPWRAWREDGTKFRADTLAGIKQAVSVESVS